MLSGGLPSINPDFRREHLRQGADNVRKDERLFEEQELAGLSFEWALRRLLPMARMTRKQFLPFVCRLQEDRLEKVPSGCIASPNRVMQ